MAKEVLRLDSLVAVQPLRQGPHLMERRPLALGIDAIAMHGTNDLIEPGTQRRQLDALAGAVAQCPLVDGFAGLSKIPPARGLQLAGHALADLAGSVFGRRPRYLPISVPPRQLGVIATDDAMTGMDRLDPGDGSWSNEITARSLLDISVHRPVRRARKAQCPLLMVVAEHDTMAPTGPALTAATNAPRGELYRSRGGHYDVYAGGLDHENVLRVETAFLQRHAGVSCR